MRSSRKNLQSHSTEFRGKKIYEAFFFEYVLTNIFFEILSRDKLRLIKRKFALHATMPRYGPNHPLHVYSGIY